MIFIQIIKNPIVISLMLLLAFNTWGKAQTVTIDQNSVSSVQSAEPSSRNVMVHIVDQDLEEFIREAARREGYEVTVSRKVRGRIQRLKLPLELNSIMRRLTPQFDLKWHYQQNHIFISTGQENTTRLVYLGVMDMNELENAMDTAGIRSETFEMSYVEESNSVLINGSASYIAGIELLAEAYNKNASNRKSNVRVIRFGRVGS